MVKLFNHKKWFKHEKKNHTLPFYTAILSIVLCMVCLAGTTWAWFFVNQVVEIEPVRSAEWTIDSLEVYQIENVSLKEQIDLDENVDLIKVPVDVTAIEDGMKFTADKDKQYLVKASIKGNSSKGFLLVETCNCSFYTTEKDISFHLLLPEDCIVKISASWGTSFGDAEIFPENYLIDIEEVPVCVCKTLCTDVNPECAVCLKDKSQCSVIENKPEFDYEDIQEDVSDTKIIVTEIVNEDDIETIE